jgi:hypothetical protein
MFGVPTSSNVDTEASEDELKTNDEGKKTRDVEAQSGSSLISPEVISSSSMYFVYFSVCGPKDTNETMFYQVLAMQKGSWRERIQKLRQNSNT